MRDRKIVFVVVGLLVGVVAVWLYQRDKHSDTPATESVTQPRDGSSSAGIAPKPRVPRSSLVVTVASAKGPIANASVRIAPEDGEVMVVKTDAKGIAIAKSLAAGDYEVSASAQDHEPAASRRKLADGEADAFTLTLVAGGRTLTGTVTDASGGGGPIGGVRIDAAKLGGTARPGHAIATTTTGSDGRYSVTVAEGQLLVAARSPDYAAQTRYVDVGASGATADFALVPGAVIEGIVLDDKTRQPIGGAAVTARRDAGAPMQLAEGGRHLITAGTDGRFRLTGLRPGAYELDASGAGKLSRQPTLVGVGVAEQIADVQLLIGRGISIQGTVVDEADKPVANATVFTMGARRGDITSNAKGEFVIEGAPPGKQVLMARSAEHMMGAPTRLEVMDQDIAGVVVRVQRGVTIKGHVEPRQQATISVEHERTGRTMMMRMGREATDADGNFEIGPSIGKATLTANCGSGDQGELEVVFRDGAPELVIKVTPGGSIAGRVVDGDGKPVAGAGVMASPTGANEQLMIVNGRVTSRMQAITNAAGQYEIKGLSPDTYRLGVLDQGRPLRTRKEPAPVKLAAAENKTGVELAVDRPNGVIKGVVTGPDGKPLADAWVSVHQDALSMIDGMHGGDGPRQGTRVVMATADMSGDGDGGGSAPPALTDQQGRFEIRGLAHSSFDVVAEAQGGKLRGRAENVKPDATIEIRALGVTSLSGTVKGPNGPPPLFQVELEGPTRTQRSFTDGNFVLGRVDPGDYTVRVTSSAGNGEAKVTVAPNTPATVEITLVANAVIVGTVVDAAGNPMPGVGVMVIAERGPGVKMRMEGPPPTSGPDGKFRVEYKAGTATLVLMTGPMPTTRDLVLEAGKTVDVGVVRVEGAPQPGPPQGPPPKGPPPPS